jgi:hypothetical protein
MWLSAIWTLPSPAPAPRPDLISLVTVLVMSKVTSIARNIHIMGPKVGPPPPIEIFTPEASDETEEAASTPRHPPASAAWCMECIRGSPAGEDAA